MIEEDQSEEAMARRWKETRRGEKKLKRAARREKAINMQREEFMRELTREPVVLHWRGGGTGSADILLKGISMDINGLELLEEVDVTLVSGRKYGLIGRNGVGKTTFLKFLSAHRFDGVPEHLQILHIEQARGGSACMRGQRARACACCAGVRGQRARVGRAGVAATHLLGSHLLGPPLIHARVTRAGGALMPPCLSLEARAAYRPRVPYRAGGAERLSLRARHGPSDRPGAERAARGGARAARRGGGIQG